MKTKLLDLIFTLIILTNLLFKPSHSQEKKFAFEMFRCSHYLQETQVKECEKN